MKLFILSFLFLNFSFASNDNFCQRSKEDIIDHLINIESRISFKNSGGLFNGGVCWWHSRLQRASAYLVKFSPDQPAPSESQVWSILKSLRSMDRVVTIPGFKDFATFSETYRSQIQKLLNQWQVSDGFINQQWIRGISGRSSLPPVTLKKQMDYIFNLYQSSQNPLWLMAQIKGITAHAFLLLEMFPLQNGYHLRLIDSNKPTLTRDVFYRHGDLNLTLEDKKYTFVPYTGFQKDYKLIALALKQHCSEYKLELALPLSNTPGQVEAK